MACGAHGQGAINVVERSTPCRSVVDRFIDGMTHAEVIGIEDQQPCIVRVAQQPVCLRSIHQGCLVDLFSQ